MCTARDPFLLHRYSTRPNGCVLSAEYDRCVTAFFDHACWGRSDQASRGEEYVKQRSSRD
jgi:hypothetical protein